MKVRSSRIYTGGVRCHVRYISTLASIPAILGLTPFVIYMRLSNTADQEVGHHRIGEISGEICDTRVGVMIRSAEGMVINITLLDLLPPSLKCRREQDHQNDSAQHHRRRVKS